MPISFNMSVVEMVDYLVNDLQKSVIDDVNPCLQGPGGYFAVPRLVLSYADYLGALYHGYTGRMNRGRRILAASEFAKAFMKDIFGPIDNNYLRYGDLLWEIYRNGTVHLYEPLKLQNSATNRMISWLTYKGSRVSFIPQYKRQVEHLVPLNVQASTWVQPISIGCLYDDLLGGIQLYASRIQSDRSLELRFRQTGNALQQPEKTNLTW